MTRFAFLADDFTGAADALWQFQRFGLRTELVVDAENLDAVSPDVDVVGVATTLRAQSADAIEAQVAAVIPALVERGARIVQYKVCSTFDSSPDVGSIGRAIDVARRSGMFRDAMPVLAAQPELGRYTQFSHHFARYGDGRIHRIDRHPVMRAHPVTPARESDLQGQLAAQTASRLSGGYTQLLDDEGMQARLAEADAAAETIVWDALVDADVQRVGRLLLDYADSDAAPVFAIGSGGLSWALAAAETRWAPLAIARPADPVHGPVLALSGSRSPVTDAQIDHAERSGWIAIDLLDAQADPVALARAALQRGRDVVLYTSRGGSTEQPATEQDREHPTARREHDPQRGSRGPNGVSLGMRLAQAALACLDDAPIGRLVVMGGDTSGEVLKELGVRSLRVEAMVPPNVPVCTVTSADPRIERLSIAIKGGQLGAPDYLTSVAAKAN